MHIGDDEARAGPQRRRGPTGQAPGEAAGDNATQTDSNTLHVIHPTPSTVRAMREAKRIDRQWQRKHPGELGYVRPIVPGELGDLDVSGATDVAVLFFDKRGNRLRKPLRRLEAHDLHHEPEGVQ